MQLGVHIGQQNLSMAELRSTWTRFDRAGIDWISLWDHLYEAPPAGGTIDHFEAVSTLGALCADTLNARIGCLVFYVGYRNPARLAKASATLDHISGGRFEIGLGAGWHEQEANAFGYPFPPLATRFDMLEEAVEIVTGMLRQDRTSFAGEHFRVDDVSNRPTPVTRIPLWIGGLGETRTIPLAARAADGWNAAYVGPDEFGRLNRVLDDACERIGRDPSEVERSVNLQFVVGLDSADADRMLAETSEFWGPMAERTMRGVLAGTPDTLVDQIDAYRAAGAHGVNIALRAPWREEAIDACLETVLPAFSSPSTP
ncbi:MAG: LLM class flavin-dependent oxidoreductase [Acidimicrobiales bacterium]